MNRELVETVAGQTAIMLHNMRTAIQTCDMDYLLCGMPVWKHVYHTLHSCDKWFINPSGPYREPAFHKEGLNSLDIPGAEPLSRDILLGYLESVQKKVLLYLSGLSDDMLGQKPDGCRFTRMTLILGQIRHFNVHLGNINAATIIRTGKWPRVVGLEDSVSDSVYE